LPFTRLRKRRRISWRRTMRRIILNNKTYIQSS
jgi:hypothetical protein